MRPGSSHFLYLLSMHAFLRRPAITYALGTFTFTLSRRTESALASPLRSKHGYHVIKNKKSDFGTNALVKTKVIKKLLHSDAIEEPFLVPQTLFII